MEQSDELVLDFEEDLDTSMSSAHAIDKDGSSVAAAGEDDGFAAHDEESEYQQDDRPIENAQNNLDQSFDEEKVDDEGEFVEEMVDDEDEQGDGQDDELDDEKRALIEEKVEEKIRGLGDATEQESASDDDESSDSDDSSSSSGESQTSSSDEADESAADSAKNSPQPTKSTTNSRRSDHSRNERRPEETRKRLRQASRSISPPPRQQPSLRVVVNGEQPRRVRSQEESRSSVSDSKKSKRLCADSSEIAAYLEDAKFFLIKSANMENVEISKSQNVWSTTKFNDKMLSENFHRVKNVILIFSVEKSGAFQGFARLCSASQHDHKPVHWVLPPTFPANRLGGVFRLKWITRRELPFTCAAHMHNPFNEDKPIKVGRDGTEIQGAVAKRLCGMFPLDGESDVNKNSERDRVASSSSNRERRREAPPPSKKRRSRSKERERMPPISSRRGDRHSRDRKSGSNCEPLSGGMSSVVALPPRRQHRDSYPPMQPSGYNPYMDPYNTAFPLMSQQQMYHANAASGPPMPMMPHFAYMSHHKYPAAVPLVAYDAPYHHRDDRRSSPHASRRKRSRSPSPYSGGSDHRRYRTTSDGRDRPPPSSYSSRDRRRSPPPSTRHRNSSRR